MKKLLITVALFTVSIASFSQEVVGTQGGSYTNGINVLDFTIGETVIETVGGAQQLTQGFHQTRWDFVGLEDFSSSVEISVYPNPMENELKIKTTHFNNIEFCVYDALGRKIKAGELQSYLTSLDVSQCSLGTYTLVLSDKMGNVLKSFKLIKYK